MYPKALDLPSNPDNSVNWWVTTYLEHLEFCVTPTVRLQNVFQNFLREP